MASEAYFFDAGSLSVETSGGTSLPIAGLQSVEVIPSVSIEQLYTGDSILIEEQQQHEFMVDVSIGYSKFDKTIADQWLGGSAGNTSVSGMTDDNDPQKYKVNTFDPVAVGSGTTLNIGVTGITFEEMPLFAASQGEYAQWDLSGTGEDINEFVTA